MLWQLQMDIKSGNIKLPKTDAKLKRQMTSARTTPDAEKSRFKMEKKTAFVSRLGFSPDRLDALAMANWLRHQENVKKKRVSKVTTIKLVQREALAARKSELSGASLVRQLTLGQVPRQFRGYR
jgi:hypothetical protein